MRLACVFAVFVAVLAAASPAAAMRRHVYLIGRSVQHRPIRVVVLGNPHAERRVLVVGCIHGNERAGIAIAQRLERASLSPKVAFWIVPVLNPDGAARNARGNAHGVDLNRNFPWRWQPLRGLYKSGKRAASEPETRAARWLIRTVKPTLSIWYHQPLRVVDRSGGDVRLQRRYARIVGMKTRELPRYPGGVVNWENRYIPRSTAVVVELRAGELTPRSVRRHARAVLALARRR
jgi:protein MpaA